MLRSCSLSLSQSSQLRGLFFAPTHITSRLLLVLILACLTGLSWGGRAAAVSLNGIDTQELAPGTFFIEATRPVAEESSFPLRRLPQVGQFRISRAGPATNSASVFVHFSGTASNGMDYEALPWFVTLPAGAEFVLLAVNAIPDDLPEGEESVIAKLSECPPETNPPLGMSCFVAAIDPGRSSAAVTIRDDAQTGPSAWVEITSPRPGQHFLFGVTITIEAVAVDPQGYIPSVEFFAGETLIGISRLDFIQAPEPGTPIQHSVEWRGVPRGRHLLFARAVDSAGTVVQSEPVEITVGVAPPRVILEIEALDPTAAERGADGLPDPAVFVIHRTSGPLDVDVSVRYSVGGTAINGGDYRPLTGELVLAAGASSVTLGVTPIADNATELEESVVVQLQPPVCATFAPPGCYQTGAAREARAVIVETLPAAIRELPDSVNSRAPFKVSIHVVPPVGTSAWALEERPPRGWAVSGIGEAGIYDPTTGSVRWGLFLNDAPRILSYVIRAPLDAGGPAAFAGVVSFDGSEAPLTGKPQTTVTPLEVRIAGITRSPNGSIQLALVGDPAPSRYDLEVSTDLRTWTRLGEFEPGGFSYFFRDESAANFPRRFYRAVAR